MDPGEFARTLSEALKPVLPVLVAGGNTARDMVTGRALTALKGAARDVVERPDDLDAAAALRLQLRRLLETDPELAAELAALVGGGPPYRGADDGGWIPVGRGRRRRC